MRTGWKIFWIVFLIIVLALILIVGVTAYQIYGLYKYAQDKELSDNINAVSKGDCSKLPVLESKSIEIKEKVFSSCKNPILAYIIRTKISGYVQEKDLCVELKNPGNIIDSNLNLAKQACSFKNSLNLSSA